MTEQIQNQLIKNLLPFIILVFRSDQDRKHTNLSKEQVLEKLRDSLFNSKEKIESKDLEQTVKSTSDPNDAIELVSKIDKMIKCSKNNILMFTYQQRRVFQKFKMNKGFSNAVTEFGISKTTINLKIDVGNFINQHPGMRKSSISLSYLKKLFRVKKKGLPRTCYRIRIVCFWLTFFIILVLSHFKPVFFL